MFAILLGPTNLLESNEDMTFSISALLLGLEKTNRFIFGNKITHTSELA